MQMLDPSIAASRMYSNSSRFIEAYHAVLQPLCREAELPVMALDILLFIANNPDKSTARDVCQFRGMKPGIVSFHVDRLAAAGLLERRQAQDEACMHRGGGGYNPARAGAAKALCRSAALRP